MLYFTQLIYIIEGQESVFDEFEQIAMPAIMKYRGRVLLRVRPSDEDYIEHGIEKPYEIHLVEFPEETDFKSFTQDEERTKFLHLKEQSVRSIFLVKGEKV